MCKLCEEFYKMYPLNKEGYHVISAYERCEAIKCGFDEEGQFKTDNWNCMTLNELRDIAEQSEDCYFYRDDLYAGTIYVLPIPEPPGDEIQRGYVILTCYKERGHIGNAIVINDEDEHIEKLSLKTAEWVIKAYRGKLSLSNHD